MLIHFVILYNANEGNWVRNSDGRSCMATLRCVAGISIGILCVVSICVDSRTSTDEQLSMYFLIAFSLLISLGLLRGGMGMGRWVVRPAGTS